MAVYTHVSAEALAAFLGRFDQGDLVSFKGIAEGVENSNYLVDTTTGRFILTLYEKRVAAGDLPFFMGLLEHLARDGNPVPRALPDRRGVLIHELCGRPACLIEFLRGVSVSHPTIPQAEAAGAAMGRMHASLATFDEERPNTLGPDGWRTLLDRCGRDLDGIEAGLFERVNRAADAVMNAWPDDLPHSVIHADLFPDNVLMLGDRVGGLIDFYFACTDIRAYDVAILHSAWAFDSHGEHYDAGVGGALIAGYRQTHPLSDAERASLSVLAKGGCLRFLATRAWDWLNTPADALVTRKDPLAYWRRYLAYDKDDLFA